MEIPFTPEQEAELSVVAQHASTDPVHFVKNAALRMLEEDRRFREGVERGLAAAKRGEFVDPAEVWAGIKKILHP